MVKGSLGVKAGREDRERGEMVNLGDGGRREEGGEVAFSPYYKSCQGEQ